MASLYPPGHPTPSETVSEAERDVLKALEKMPSGWHVIHSLWLKTHHRKLHAEADFVVITDKSVVVLEVKGGEVWRDDSGVWNFRNRAGKTAQKREGPFEQAMGAYYAIRTHLEASGRLDLFDRFTWGYGVICPDCIIGVVRNDAFIDERMLMDASIFPSGLYDWVRRLEDYWGQRLSTKERISGIPSAVRSEIGAYLRPRYGVLVGPAARSVHAENELIELTRKQMEALDYMGLEPRNLLVGAAGTGKTVLAIEQVRRMTSQGKKVLFVCFNRLLAARIQRDLAETTKSLLDAGTYHQITANLCRRAGLSLPVGGSWEEFCDLLRSRSAELVSSLSDSDLYDYLVVDEGQDLLGEEFFELLGCLLKGGLRHGSWMVTCDRDQLIYYDNFDEDVYLEVASLAKSTPLLRNCRNTRAIAAYVRGFTELGADCADGASGENPVIRYYKSQQDYLVKLKTVVNDLIVSFDAAGVPPSEIILLYGDRTYIPDQILKSGFFLRSLSPVEEDKSGAVRLCSVQAFKGLDARAVVLVGTGDFASDLSKNLFYVGASRARTTLRILLQEPCPYASLAISRVLEILGPQ